MEEALTQKTPAKHKIDNDIVEQGYILNDWFIFRNERHFGPLTTKQVRYLLSKKFISNQHHIWRPGFTGWVPMESIEGFRSYGKRIPKTLSDDEFSTKAMLSGIDRIGAEYNEIDFIDKSTSGAYELKKYTKERLDQGLPPYTVLSERIDVALRKVGIDFKYAKTAVFSCVGVLMAAGLYMALRAGTPDALVGMPEGFQEKLLAVSARAESVKNPSLEIFPQDLGASDPVLVAGTNLPIGSRVLIEVKGKPKTLLGSYRFAKKIETTTDSKLFKTPPIRENSGKFIPPGVYSVVATCLSCSNEKTKLYSEDFTFGVTDTASYKNDLIKFHQDSRENAGLELTELKDLVSNLDGQFVSNSRAYLKTLNGGSAFRFDRFSATWLLNQRKLIELFDQMKAPEFQSKLFYLSLYNAFNKVIVDLFELHMMQSGLVDGGLKDKSEILQASQRSAQIKQRLAYLKSQLSLMKVNFNSTTGMPDTTGLNL